MRIFDAFCGTKSATAAFTARGHEVRSLDIEPHFEPTYTMDIRNFARNPQAILGDWEPHFAWLSPPCQRYCLAASSAGEIHWAHAKYQLPLGDEWPFYGPRFPLTADAKNAVAFVLAGLQIIKKLQPPYWVLENPMGGLRTMGFMRQVPGNHLISYCQYGDTRMKRTSLWGILPPTFELKDCKPNSVACNHARGPRGSRTPGSTQGLTNSVDRARVPFGLSEQLCIALEQTGL